MRFNPFKQVDFLYFYSLQAGVVICSSIGIFLSITTLTVNLASENSEVDGNILLGHYFLIGVYCGLAFLGFLIGLVSAYQETVTVIYVSLSFQSIAFLYWLCLLILSFLNNDYFTRRICLEYRCPDHLWLQDARWRNYITICDPEDTKLPIYYKGPQSGWIYAEDGLRTRLISGVDYKNNNITLEGNAQILHMSSNKSLKPIEKKLQQDDVGMYPGIADKVWSTEGDIGKIGLMVLSGIFALMLLAFFIYSITTLISYRNELKELEWEVTDNDDNVGNINVNK